MALSQARPIERGARAPRPAESGDLPESIDPRDEPAIEALAEIFRALADPTRLRIVSAIAVEPRCVSDLATLAGVSEPAASQHLRVLRTLRIVQRRRLGKQVYYSLEDEHVRDLLAVGLGHIAESRPQRKAG